MGKDRLKQVDPQSCAWRLSAIRSARMLYANGRPAGDKRSTSIGAAARRSVELTNKTRRPCGKAAHEEFSEKGRPTEPPGTSRLSD